jgi:Big-like domain-containing protein
MKSKLRLAGAFAALATLALAVSCRGFFVNPTLTSITVAPATPTIQTGTTNNTVQMTAAATFNDGSTGHAPVTWTIAPASSGGAVAATISMSGLVTASANTVGTMSVTATSTQISTISGSTTVAVTAGCITSIAVSPTSPSVTAGTSQPFTATATTCNGPVTITEVATWVSSNTAVATIDATGNATTLAPGTTQITASSGGVTSPAVTLTVN